jgi:YidC/Oxa1 family membrane protein insertase
MMPAGRNSMIKAWVVAWLLGILAITGQGAAVASPASPAASVSVPAEGSLSLVQPLVGGQGVIDTHRFYGLAQYLNSASFYKVSAAGIEALPAQAALQLGAHEWLAVVGRYHALVLKGDGLQLTLGEQQLQLASAGGQAPQAYLGEVQALAAIDPMLSPLRYAHLWRPLAVLAIGLEWLLAALQQATGLGWGLALVLYAVAIKLLLLPATLVTTRLQARVEEHKRALAPRIAAIKQAHKGEQAHELIMQAHKERGLSPFYTLKPMLGLLVQIPVLIATFNVLAGMPALVGAPFLWVADLAYPDALAMFPVVLPGIGNSFNLMPILMALVSMLPVSAPQAANSKRVQQIGLALLFLAFFYTFPAAMVFYWLLANALRWAEQRLFPSAGKQQDASSAAR